MGGSTLDLDAALDGIASSGLLEGCDVRRLAVREPAPVDLERELTAALAQPTGSRSLAEMARGRRTAAIITSDATRAVPNRALLPPIVAELHAAGIPDERITVVIGTGAHRAMSRDEIAELLGGEWAGRLRVCNHDPRAADLVHVGCTPGGNEIRVNRVVAEADLRVALGQVEPHEFAGYTGGRKAILPAVAGYDSILHNHRIEMLADPGARPGELAGNPIHQEMVAAARLARLDFIVNVAIDRELRPLAVAVGDLERAHARLVAFIEGFARVKVPDGTADLVVTGPGRPLDSNLYQSIKPLVALEASVGPETVVVLLSACAEGTGSAEMLEPFVDAADTQEALARVREHYTIEKDHAFFLARFLSRCPQVVAHCPGVKDDELRALMLTPAPSVDAAVRAAVGRVQGRGRRPLVLLFPRPQRALLQRY